MSAISRRPTELRNPGQANPPENRARAKLRREQLLSIASDLFGKRGFEATSMRDIATAAKIMSGSLYYHFASKEEIYIAVMDASITKLRCAVEAAIEAIDDPWERLEEAAVAHCEAILNPAEFRLLITPLFPPNLAPAIRAQLVDQRDRFERIIGSIISGLPLKEGFDDSVFRFQYLGAINWVQIWYKPDGGFEPAKIARQIVRTMRGALKTEMPAHAPSVTLIKQSGYREICT